MNDLCEEKKNSTETTESTSLLPSSKQLTDFVCGFALLS